MTKPNKVKTSDGRELKKTRVIFDASSRDYLMRANGCSVGFNMPKALSGEHSFGLPPYGKRMPYLVDKFPACPDNWMKSEGKINSYFVPVKEGDGMWLDFNGNDSNTHHVAIVVSIQGINPITGLPCNDAQLEQYIEECPKHKIKFGPDRYCKECDYKWPKQNYICTTGTPNGYLWLDGFRAADGIVRQYLLTAEKMKGVASNIIGKDRVFAIGVSFFLSKEKKPPITFASRGCIPTASGSYDPPVQISSPIWKYVDDFDSGGVYDSGSNKNAYTFFNTCDSLNINSSNSNDMSNTSISCSSSPSSLSKSAEPTVGELGKKREKASQPKALFRSANVNQVNTKNLEVAAGAKISQVVYDDPEKLDFWHNEPESIICINYCLESDARKIIEQGMINLEGSKEGFLQDVPVGN